MVCFAEVYENHAKSILGLPRSAGNQRNRRTLPIQLLHVEKEHFHFSDLSFGIFKQATGHEQGANWWKKLKFKILGFENWLAWSSVIGTLSLSGRRWNTLFESTVPK
jgi:hypothetical protein